MERVAMNYRFFAIPALTPDEAETALNRFCAAHRVASIEKQFVSDGERSFWSVCVCYQSGETLPLPAGKGAKIDYREVLNEQDFAVYAKLRQLRKEFGMSGGYSQRTRPAPALQGAGIAGGGAFVRKDSSRSQRPRYSLIAVPSLTPQVLSTAERYVWHSQRGRWERENSGFPENPPGDRFE
jgi:hypothetical protein